MEKPEFPRRKNMRLKGYDYTTPGAYFVTICTAVRKKDVLCSVTVGGGLCAAPNPELTAIGEIVDRAIRDIPLHNPDVEVDIYCIMPDHIHLIVSWSGRHRDRPLQDIIAKLKSYTDRQFGGGLWQSGYYDHIIRNPADLRETREYILTNPAKWINRRTDTDG